MDTSRVGPGEWIAAASGLVLLIALFFLDWYSLEPNIAIPTGAGALLAQAEAPTEIPPIDVSGFSADIGAWDGQGFLGTLANLILIAAGLWAIVAVFLKAGNPESAPPVDSTRLTVLLGLGATLMVVLRIIFTPGDSEFLDVGLTFGIFVALIGAVGIALGGMMSRDGTIASTGAAPPPPPSQPPPPPPPSQPPPPPPPPPSA
jgi:hypothetical protein